MPRPYHGKTKYDIESKVKSLIRSMDRFTTRYVLDACNFKVGRESVLRVLEDFRRKGMLRKKKVGNMCVWEVVRSDRNG